VNLTVNRGICGCSRDGAEEGTADPASTSDGGRSRNQRTRILIINGARDLDPIVGTSRVNGPGCNRCWHQEGVASSWNSGASRVTNAAETLEIFNDQRQLGMTEISIYLICADANGVVLIGQFLDGIRRCAGKLVVVGRQSSRCGSKPLKTVRGSRIGRSARNLRNANLPRAWSGGSSQKHVQGHRTGVCCHVDVHCERIVV